jgi:hypothetical protein
MAVKRNITAVPASSRMSAPRKIRDAALAEEDTVGSLPSIIDPRSEALMSASFESRDPQKYVSEIESLWRRAQESFLDIGKRLISARRLIEERALADNALLNMPKSEQRRATEQTWKEFLSRLPFTQGIASQLEIVARALEAGRLGRDELPNNYSTAYQLTTLTDAELDVARTEEGVVGPRATRQRVIEFKQRLRQKRVEHREALKRRHKRIMDEIARLQEEAARLLRELSDDQQSSEESRPSPNSE